MLITLNHLRRYAVARSLFKPTTLKGAFYRMGFVQADPIRAPARAQDLILRHRVKDYHAGDLERLYPKLKIEEDFFVVYGVYDKVASGAHASPLGRRCASRRTSNLACRAQETRAVLVGICEGTR